MPRAQTNIRDRDVRRLIKSAHMSGLKVKGVVANPLTREIKLITSDGEAGEVNGNSDINEWDEGEKVTNGQDQAAVRSGV